MQQEFLQRVKMKDIKTIIKEVKKQMTVSMNIIITRISRKKPVVY